MSSNSVTTKSASPTAEQIASLESGIEICWDVRGEGPPIVLVMGIGAQMILWPDGFCDMLAARGFRVIRFDNRDVGRSSKLDALGVPPLLPTLTRMVAGMSVAAPYALEDMAGDIAGLLDVLEIEHAHIVGASMGGMIAQTMAITHPHRMRSLVSMMSTTGKPAFVSTPRALKALFGPPPRSREEAIRSHVALFRVVRSTGFDFDEEALIERAGLAWDCGVSPRGVLRQLGAMAATGDRTARLRFVRVPTLVVHGTVDPLIRPLGGELTAEAIPGAELRMVKGMGHDIPRGAWPMLTDMIARHAERADAS